VQGIKLARHLKVVVCVDFGNGAAGVIVPELFEALNCEVIPLLCEVDGNFPSHHPNPGKPENLVDLIDKVKEANADLGLFFDRVGVVTNTGSFVYPDRLRMLFSRDGKISISTDTQEVKNQISGGRESFPNQSNITLRRFVAISEPRFKVTGG